MRDLLCSEAAQVIALANQGFAFLEKAIGDRGAGVQRLEVLAELVELRADVQEHEHNSPVRRVAAVVFHVALHLQRPRIRSWSWRDRALPRPSHDHRLDARHEAFEYTGHDRQLMFMFQAPLQKYFLP